MPSLTSMFAFVTAEQSKPLPAATARRLVVGVVCTLLSAIATVAAMVVLLQKPDWMRGLIAAGVVSALASGLSLIPLVWGFRRSLNAAFAGYFLAMGVRLSVSLGGALLAIHAGGYPQAPTLLLTAVFYVTVLAAESLIVAVSAWSM